MNTTPNRVRCRTQSLTIRKTLLAAAIAASLSPIAAQAQAPAVDGLLHDWSGVGVLASDPNGDSTGPIDLTALRVQSRGTMVYAQIDIAAPLNLSSGPVADTTLRLVATRGTRTLTLDFRGRRAYLDGNTASLVSWPTLRYVALPTVATTRFELQFDAAIIGGAVGDTLSFTFSGADSIASPANFVLAAAEGIVQRRAAARPTCTALRVASYNTFLTGFADAARRAVFVRLLDSVNADVYVFQEEYNSTQAQVLSIIQQADPLDNGAVWTVIKSGELAIASPYPMVTVNLGTAHQAVVVRPPNGPDTLVVTNHLKCCGYTGNSDDSQRISQTTAAISAFNAFRAGTLNAQLATYRNVPAVVLGDWNLVGSSTPLNLWRAGPSPALKREVVRHLVGGDTWTWASPDGLGFWPGELDIAAFDAARMRVVGSFMLDSRELNATELTTMGLQAADSAASDHLLMVLDLASGRSADVDESGSFTEEDVFAFVDEWFGTTGGPGPGGACAALLGGCPGDWNASGRVDADDIMEFVRAWLAARAGGC